MAKFIQFIKNRFKLLVIASAAILVVTIVLFIVIDNGVSTNNSIKQIKKQIADDGNKTWYFYPDYSKSVEMEVGIDKDTKHL